MKKNVLILLDEFQMEGRTFETIEEPLMDEYGDSVSVRRADSREEALAILSQNDTTHVLIGIDFPKMREGLPLLPHIRTVAPKTQIIGMTFSFHDHDKELFKRNGVEKVWECTHSIEALFPLLSDLQAKDSEFGQKAVVI